VGLHKAAVLALRLLGRDERLQEAIRRQLDGTRPLGPRDKTPRRGRRTRASNLAALTERRRKLLDLYYSDKISPEGFAEEDRRIAAQIEAVRVEAAEGERKEATTDEVSVQFESVAAALRDLDIDAV
jgi:hypothetical protein